MSRSKDNQTNKVSQLIECNIFLWKKSYAKYGGETIPRLFSQKQKLIKSLDQTFEVLHSSF